MALYEFVTRSLLLLLSSKLLFFAKKCYNREAKKHQ